MIFRSKLSIDRRFGDLAKISFSSTLVWQGSVVGLAFLGFGPFSFVVPLIVQALYESLAGWFYVRQMPQLTDHLSVGMFQSLFRETRWVMSSTALLSLAITGDYFVVGLIGGKDTVGIYFFAFQLVISLAQLFNNGVETVFPSLLRSLNSDKTRQAAAFYKTVKMLLLASIPVSMAFAFLASPLLHTLWQGKWDSAITAVQLLTACIPAWIVVSAGRALLEARGLWRMRFIMLAAYGAGGMASAGLGAMAGGVTEIAMAVSGYYVLFSLVVMAVGSGVVDLPRGNILKSAYMPLLLTLICAAASVFLVGKAFNDYPNLVNELAAFLTFSLLVAMGNIIVFNGAWKEVADTFLHSVRGRVQS
jgi:O-antigen/teichoic acid export membrane protein